MKKKTKNPVFKNFLTSLRVIFKHEKKYLFLRVFMTILEPIRVYMYALILNNAIAVLESSNPTFEKLLINVGVATIINLILGTVLRNCQELAFPLSEKLTYKIILERSIQTLELDYELLEEPTGQEALERATRYNGEWNGIVGLANRGLRTIQYLIQILIGSAIILTINIWLVVCIISLAVFKIFLENRRQTKVKKINDEAIPQWRRVNYVNNISTNLSIGKDLRVYNMDKFIEDERNSVFKSILKNIRKRITYNTTVDIIIHILAAIDSIILYGFLLYEVLNNGMLISTFTFMLASISNVTSSLTYFAKEYSHTYRCSLESIDYLVIMGDKYKRKTYINNLPDEEFSIEFKNVYYQYAGQVGYALEDVSFKIKKGEKIALVGYNGAGKTTLTKLICGLYHPTKGQILVNGIDIETLKRDELAKAISPVFQETLIYAYDVKSNVSMAYGTSIDYERVIKSTKIVGVDEKIESLKDKYETMLTRDLEDDGIELSGGESQKLAIARAIYKNAPLYILDEPTSALDPLAEAKIYQNFNEVVGGNSVIYISHRLSSTKFCDKVIVLDNGKIKETGTHYELIKEDTLYKKLFDMQAEYYKGEQNNE